MSITKIIGKRVAQERKAKRLSQSELAALANIDRSFISEIENGKKNISVVVLEKMAIALQVEMADLLRDSSLSPESD